MSRLRGGRLGNSLWLLALNFLGFWTPESGSFMSLSMRTRPPDVNQIERHFVLLCHQTTDAFSRGQFSLDSLPEVGADLLVQCVNSGILLSQTVRTDTNVWGVLVNQGMTIQVNGNSVRRKMKLDERSTASILQHALLHAAPPESPEDAEQRWKPMRRQLQDRSGWRARKRQALWLDGQLPPVEGVTVHLGDSVHDRLLSLVQSREGMRLMTLDAAGDPLPEVLERNPPKEMEGVVVVLGDREGIEEAEQAALAALGAVKASLGDIVYLACQSIVVLHHSLDTALGTRYHAQLARSRHKRRRAREARDELEPADRDFKLSPRVRAAAGGPGPPAPLALATRTQARRGDESAPDSDSAGDSDSEAQPGSGWPGGGSGCQ